MLSCAPLARQRPAAREVEACRRTMGLMKGSTLSTPITLHRMFSAPQVAVTKFQSGAQLQARSCCCRQAAAANAL